MDAAYIRHSAQIQDIVQYTFLNIYFLHHLKVSSMIN